jgi:transcriptional regulator with XRE-family HTH domain
MASSGPGRGNDPGNDPKVRLGRQLRRARQAAGFTTQGPVATRLGVSVDLVSKVETGKHVPTQDIFLALLDLYQVSEEARDYLTDMWEVARGTRGKVPELIEKWFENEARALFLRLWGLLFMPAQLQTSEYARAMFLLHGMDEDEATVETDIRIGRQGILNRPDPVHVTAVIHERALYNLVGTPEIMVAQLTRLIELSHQRNVVIQVVRDTGYFAGMDGAFEIASGDAIPDTLLMLAVDDQTSDDQMRTRKIIVLFEQIRGYALNVEESRALILEAIERWKTQQR